MFSFARTAHDGNLTVGGGTAKVISVLGHELTLPRVAPERPVFQVISHQVQ